MRSTDEPLVEHLSSYFRAFPGGRVLVAYSGGGDSTALLAGMASVRERHDLSVTAAHFDHGLQPEVHRRHERDTVVAVCEALGVELRTGSAAPGEIEAEAGNFGCGVEAAARRRRYAFLSDVAVSVGATLLATAHHRDDQVETVLLRVLHGATISGLGGIPERRQFQPGVTLIRPMLDVPKATIESFLLRCGLPWCEDPSNQSDRFARNRVRKRLLPEIRAAFPSAETAIARFARRNAGAAAFIAQEARRRIPWEHRSGGYVVDADRFWSADPVLRVESILSLMNSEGEGDRVPARMLDVLRERPKGGGVVMRGRGWTLYQLAGRLWYGRSVAHALESGYLFRVYGPGTCDVALPFVPDSETSITVPWAGPIPLVVRSPRPGDTVQVGGLTKTLKRLLPECGVPSFQRPNVPIVEDRYGILAVVGSVTGGRERFADRAADYAGESVEIRLRGRDPRDTID